MNYIFLKNRFNKLLFLTFLVCIFTVDQSYSQKKYNFNTFSNDFENVLKQPSKWKKSDLLKIAGIASLTYGTMYIDGFVREFAVENQSYRNSIPVEFGRIWGEPYLSLTLGSGFYLHGLATNNRANKKLGFEIGESSFYTVLITMIFKYAFGRERPRENSNVFSYFPFSFKSNNYVSLNSGHTALAFSLSTIIAKNTDNYYLKAILFVPAFMTAFSRVYQNHHWTSDVLLGGIIGFSVAEFVTSLHKSKIVKENENIIPQSPIKLIDLKFPF